MAGGRSEFARPASLALMAIAAVGWAGGDLFLGRRACRCAPTARRRCAAPKSPARGSSANCRNLQRARRLGGGPAQEARRRPQGARRRRGAAHQRAERSRRTHPQGRRDRAFARLRDRPARFEDRAAEGHDSQSEDARRTNSATSRRKSPPPPPICEKAQTGARRGAEAQARAADASAVAAKTAETDARAKADELAKAADAAKAQLDELEAKIEAARKTPAAVADAARRRPRWSPAPIRSPSAATPMREAAARGRRLRARRRKCCEQALERAPDWAPAWFALGEARRKARRRAPAAAAAFRAALRADPDDAHGAGPRLALAGTARGRRAAAGLCGAAVRRLRAALRPPSCARRSAIAGRS